MPSEVIGSDRPVVSSETPQVQGVKARTQGAKVSASPYRRQQQHATTATTTIDQTAQHSSAMVEHQTHIYFSFLVA